MQHCWHAVNKQKITATENYLSVPRRWCQVGHDVHCLRCCTDKSVLFLGIIWRLINDNVGFTHWWLGLTAAHHALSLSRLIHYDDVTQNIQHHEKLLSLLLPITVTLSQRHFTHALRLELHHVCWRVDMTSDAELWSPHYLWNSDSDSDSGVRKYTALDANCDFSPKNLDSNSRLQAQNQIPPYCVTHWLCTQGWLERNSIFF